MCLARDDLPIAVALQPGVGDVITRFQVLAEDRLRLVRIVSEYRRVANDPALGVYDFDCSRITGRQRGDVGYQFWFIEDAAFFVGKDAVVGEVFLPWCLITGNDGIVKLLRATD